MNNEIKIFGERYFAVQPNLSYQEYETKETALTATKFLIIVETLTGVPKSNGWYSNSKNYETLFINANDLTTTYVYNGWKLEYMGPITYFGGLAEGGGKYMRIKIADPTGALKTFDYFADDWISTFLQFAYRRFLKYSAEKDLRTVELLEENEKLKNEIAELKKKRH